jgi:uncharacterized repeat protein (TIGR04076 family)
LKGCKLIGKIVKVEGECSAGHRVGEEFDLTLYSEKANKSLKTPNICGFFYDAIFPYLVELFHGKRTKTSLTQAAQTTTRL